MKNTILTFLGICSALLIGMGLVAQAAPVTPPTGGGTGLSSASSTGTCLIVSSTNPFAYYLGSCGSGAGGSSTVLYPGYMITLAPNPINTTGTVSVNTSTLTSYIATLGYLTQASGTANFYPLSSNPSNFTTTTIQSVLNTLSALGPASYNSSTGQFSCPNCAVTNADNAFTTGQTVNGNVTTTNLTVSSTFNVNGTTYLSGNVSMGTSTQNGNLYVSSGATTVARIRSRCNQQLWPSCLCNWRDG